MFKPLKLFQFSGVPVYSDLSFTVFFLFICFGGLPAILLFVGLYGIVLAHEFGHVLAAQYLGYKAERVILTPIGGMACVHLPTKPEHELVVILAGPMVNLLLVPVLAMTATNHLMAILNLCNLTMLIFNLLPVFPMDGGRVLRALLSRWTKRHLLATLIATRIGQFACLLFVLYGVYSYRVDLFIVGILMSLLGQAELVGVREQHNSEFRPKNETELTAS